MSWTRGTSGRPPIAWDIDIAANVAAAAAADTGAAATDPELIEAMLADHYRDQGIVPLAPHFFGMITSGMAAADWERLAVIAGMFAHPQLRTALGASTLPVRDQVHAGMVTPAKALSAVDPRMIAAYTVRAEELARQVARGLGVAFAGETAAQSAARLAHIDYMRLLAKVDAAKESAAEHTAELLRRQEQDDARVPRRGKW